MIGLWIGRKNEALNQSKANNGMLHHFIIYKNSASYLLLGINQPSIGVPSFHDSSGMN